MDCAKIACNTLAFDTLNQTEFITHFKNSFLCCSFDHPLLLQETDKIMQDGDHDWKRIRWPMKCQAGGQSIPLGWLWSCTFTGIKTWTYLEAIIKPTITRSGEARIQTPRSAWQQRLSCESPGQQEYPWHLISREEDAWALQPAGRWILIQPGPKLTQVVANLLDYHPHASVWSIYLAEQGRLWALKSDSSRFHSAQWPLPALWPWAWI